MTNFSKSHLFLPDSLRAALGRPIGELISGSIEETIPKLKKSLTPHDYLLVAVGDVTANLFVENNFDPNIIITDGQTKRTKLKEWKDWDGFEILEAKCPPAEITPQAWSVLIEAIHLTSNSKRVHVKIEGEEDLLVLPLLIELPIGSKIVYGQPNVGAVIRVVDKESKVNARSILDKMDRKS